MGRGDVARGRPRGGEDIQASRQTGTRVAAGVAALAVTAVLAALPLARGSEAVVEVGSRVTIAALLALVAALVLGWSSLVTAALVLVGGLYGGQLAVDDASLDAGVPLFAAGVVLTAELAYWSLEEREGVRGEPGAGARRLVFLALLTLATLVVSGALLVLVDGVNARGLAVDVVGAAAAAAVLVAVVLAARGRDRTST